MPTHSRWRRCAPEQIDDRAIEELWLAFERLGRLGVAMGRVDGHGLFVREDGSAALGEFADATVAAERSMVLADKAQLLVVTALAVGRERAVPIAARTVGNEALEEALPYLQHAALDPEVWHAVKARDWSLEELRVMAEQETGSAPKELEELRRVTWGSILKLALIGLVTYALFSAISNVGIDTIIAEIQSASKGWFVAALLLTPLAQVPQAVSTLGATIQRLALLAGPDAPVRNPVHRAGRPELSGEGGPRDPVLRASWGTCRRSGVDRDDRQL